MVDEPDVLSDSKNENGLLFDKRKALKRIEELEGEQIKTARREMVLAVVGTMKAGKSTTINAIVGQEILPNRNRPMTSVPTLIRHVPGKTEPVLHLEHIQPVRNLLITLQEKLATPAGQQVAQSLQQTGDTRELLDILADDVWLKNEYHGEDEIFTGLASLNDLVRLAAAMGTEFPFDEYAEVQKLPVIDVAFSHLVGMDACQGTLTLLDTPGPNEAGQPTDGNDDAGSTTESLCGAGGDGLHPDETRKPMRRFVKSLMPLLTSQPVVCLCWSINSMKKIAMVMVRMPYARRCQQC
ncbi:putative vimentin [Escherichia coli]|nr:putative vimentin [Escherichia coli]